MALKPLPPKMQRQGRKIAMLITIILGLIFGGSVGAFIGLTVSMKTDQYIDTESTTATSLKDVNDGYIYATKDNNIVYKAYDSTLVQKINIKEQVSSFTLSGELSSISSMTYVEQSSTLYTTLSFFEAESTKTNVYLFKWNKSNNNFVLDSSSKFATVKNPITSLCENGDYIYTAIRDGSRCTMTRFNKKDLSLEADSGYLYRSVIEFDDNGNPKTTYYSSLIDSVIYNISYFNDTSYFVTNTGVIGIKNGCFKNYPSSLNEKTVDFDSSKYANYIFYNYSSPNNTPHGAVKIGDECYMITDIKGLAKFNFNGLSKEIPYNEENPEVNESRIGTLTFCESAPEKRNGFFYSSSSSYGAVITELGSSITFLNMKDTSNIYIEFIDVAEVNITDVVISSNGKLIYYLCENSQVSGSNNMMLKVKSVDDVNQNIRVGRFTPTLFVIAIITVLLFIVALLCWIKPMFLEKFIGFIKNFKQNWVVYLILAGCLTLLGMFCYYPAVGSISMSFFRYENNKPIVWNNFGNYVQIFTDSAIWQSFGNMVIFLITDIITAIIPPLIFAFFLTVMKNRKYSAVTRTLLFLPSVIPGITKMMIWQNGIYGENGVINMFVKLFNGQPVAFFNGSNFDIGWLILMGFPYVGSYLVFYGALMNIPSSYYEAAELEGLNIWKRFFKIDIPLIEPQIKYVVILTIIASVQNFGRTYMINSSLFTVRTPIHIMYDYINNGNYGLSSAIAAILFVLLLAATLFNFRKQKTQLGDSI